MTAEAQILATLRALIIFVAEGLDRLTDKEITVSP